MTHVLTNLPAVIEAVADGSTLFLTEYPEDARAIAIPARPGSSATVAGHDDDQLASVLNEGWHDQYKRMLRSRDRLQAAGLPDGPGSDAARDAVVHFFQDAYHLKDWLKNDPATREVATGAVERLVTNTTALSICADICNGWKHFGPPTPPRTGDPATAVVSQSVTVHLGHGSAHGWTVESNGETYDLHDLADAVVYAWDAWLTERDLLPQ